MQDLKPPDTVPLFEPLHAELTRLLRGLSPEDWDRPTVARGWTVKDVAAHLLDGDLRVLSFLRDGHAEPPDVPIGGYDDLVGFLDRLNARFVVAARRLSPRLLTELLEWTGPQVAAVYAALPPDEPAAFAVDWAGESTSTNRMHVGREYTERWHHQQQIRDAVDAPPLYERRWLYPLLDLSMRALPRAYRGVASPERRALVVEVTGEGGGAWSLWPEDGEWVLVAGAVSEPRARIEVDPETAWKTLYHALPPETALARARVEGDTHLAEPFFGARSVMVRGPKR